MKSIESWFIILGIINLVLLITGLKFILPEDFFKRKNIDLLNNLRNQIFYLGLIFAVVLFHLIEVNLIDPIFTSFISKDFALYVHAFENDIVYWFSQHWNNFLIYFFVVCYIGIYPFTLWFSPFYFLLTNEKNAMKNLAYGLLLIYIITLPFYLLIPITNVYTYYNLESALENVIPGIENFFYSTTTHNNCIPSLHTAMTILIAYTASLTKNKKFMYFTYFVAATVIISVIYLAIHWLTDIITGAIVSLGVILILKHYLQE